MRPHILPLTTIALVVTMPLVGCTAGDTNSDTAEPSTDTANVAIQTDPTSFDPALARTSDDYYADRLLYDTLLRRDDGGALVGGLATSWEASSASEYSFVIRDDATCSDGTPITATIVADSLARFVDPAIASAGRTLAVGSATAEVTADDDASTVSIVLSKDWADLPTGLTLPHSGIVCPAGLEDPAGLAAGTADGAFSGPYTIATATPAVRYELALRDDYDTWPEFSKPLDGIPPATIFLTPYADLTTRATQMLSGGLDIASFSDENIARFENNDAYTIDTVTQLTTYLLFNQREGSLFAGNRALREAVAQAVDQVAFNDVISDGRGAVLTSVASPAVECVSTDKSLLTELDPDAASAVLQGVTIRMVGTTLLNEGNEYVAEVLRNAGATVELQTLDNANWTSVTTAGGSGWDLTVQGDINIAGTLVSSLLRVMGPATENGGRNKVGVVNEAGYAFVQEALSTSNLEERCASLQAAQESILTDVDAAPLGSWAEASVAAEGFSIRTFGDYIDPATIRIIG